MLCFMLSIPVFATDNRDKGREERKEFSDVKSGFWAYDAIDAMTRQKILSGYDDCTFKPDKTVNREEFAKMMVLALQLKLTKPESPTFGDVSTKDWAYPYIETAKPYLTGFRNGDKDYFRPTGPAVREDMAVALVKALSYSNETPNYENLEKFDDVETISPNLKKYVAIAIQKKVMQGYPADKNGNQKFGSQDTLTRAEAAVLLFRFVKNDSEKVTYDEEKITYDNENNDEDKDEEINGYPVPKVSSNIENGKVILKWQEINDKRLQGYKVVISKYNDNPKYPDDGYFKWITDRNQTTAVIQGGNYYNGGDIHGEIKRGETYYFSITAVYDGAKIPGNTIKVKVPE